MLSHKHGTLLVKIGFCAARRGGNGGAHQRGSADDATNQEIAVGSLSVCMYVCMFVCLFNVLGTTWGPTDRVLFMQIHSFILFLREKQFLIKPPWFSF